MNFNDTNVDGVQTVEADVNTEYELFDELPKELRDLLNYCPIKATALTLYYKTFWQGYTVRPDIKEQWKKEFRAAFPEYAPIKGDDFPVE